MKLQAQEAKLITVAPKLVKWQNRIEACAFKMSIAAGQCLNPSRGRQISEFKASLV